MSEWPTIRKILGICFSSDVGLSRDAALGVFKRCLAVAETRDALEAELVAAFSASTPVWTELLYNRDYEVMEANSEQEAREWAKEYLWKTTFGAKSLPLR